MPFKSEAQRRKIYQLEKEGKVPEGTSARWEEETSQESLPERRHHKKTRKTVKVIR